MDLCQVLAFLALANNNGLIKHCIVFLLLFYLKIYVITKKKDYEKFFSCFWPDSKTAIKTFLNFENYIVNAFDYELSNGVVEGTNNIIKQLKHNACGYRKLSHLKARVMLVKGIYNPLVV